MATAQGGPTDFDGDRLQEELEENGYTVIPDLMTPTECDALTSEFKAWLDKFDDGHTPLQKRTSVIQSYRVGHFEPSWKVRLKAKAVFQAIWGTDKLLSSIDGIAIAEPPEDADEYRKKSKDCLHIDQGAWREGLHAYQGAIYLEEQTPEDYCFRVLAKSHLYHSELFQTFPDVVAKTKNQDFYKLSTEEKNFYYKKGCTLESVSVPKGGIILWDSRTVYDNIPPIAKRPNPDRWRLEVFVSMTPAVWASEKDMALKKDVYRRMLLTSHWSSQGLKTHKEYKVVKYKKNFVNVSIDTLPDIARSREAKLLAGDERYNFQDGNPNGPDPPKWRSETN